MDIKRDIRKIDLDGYTEGDTEFKRELAGLLIENIAELETSLHDSIKARNAAGYLSACHKLTTSIGILNAEDYTEVVEAIRQILVEKRYPSGLLDQHVSVFTQLSRNLTEGLRMELRQRKDDLNYNS